MLPSIVYVRNQTNLLYNETSGYIQSENQTTRRQRDEQCLFKKLSDVGYSRGQAQRVMAK